MGDENKICIVLFKVILYKVITLKPYLIKILLLDKHSEIYLRKLFGYKWNYQTYHYWWVVNIKVLIFEMADMRYTVWRDILYLKINQRFCCLMLMSFCLSHTLYHIYVHHFVALHTLLSNSVSKSSSCDPQSQCLFISWTWDYIIHCTQ